jgi:hypothetical protein
VPITTDTNLRAAKLRFAVVTGETGRVFLGVAGRNKATGAGALKEFRPTGPGGGIADKFVFESLNRDPLRRAGTGWWRARASRFQSRSPQGGSLLKPRMVSASLCAIKSAQSI